jgi:hypothetical protein
LARLHRAEQPYTQEYKDDPKVVKLDLAIYWHRQFCRECNGRLGALNEDGLELMKSLTMGEALALTFEDQRIVAGWVLRTCLSMEFAVRQPPKYRDQTSPWWPDPAYYLTVDELPRDMTVCIGGHKTPSADEPDTTALIDVSDYALEFFGETYIRHLTLWRFAAQLVVGEDAGSFVSFPEECGHIARIWPPKDEAVTWPRPYEYNDEGVRRLGNSFVIDISGSSSG